jgi:hypothetical protein
MIGEAKNYGNLLTNVHLEEGRGGGKFNLKADIRESTGGGWNYSG